MRYNIFKQVKRIYQGNTFYRLNLEQAFYLQVKTPYYYQINNEERIEYECTEIIDLSDVDIRDIISKLTQIGFQYINKEYKARFSNREEPPVEITIRIDRV